MQNRHLRIVPVTSTTTLPGPGTSRSFRLERSLSTGKRICSLHLCSRSSDEMDLWFLENDPRKQKRPERGRWSQDSDSSLKILISASIKSRHAWERLAGS